MKYPIKRPKYRNRKVTVDGEKYDSTKEYRRYGELLLMQNAGLICDLKRQVMYELIPSVKLNGRNKPALRYCSDFTYYQEKGIVVEDCKSPITRKTAAYRMKKHLMKWRYGIEIKET